MTQLTTRFDQLRRVSVDRTTVGWVAFLLNLQLLAVVSYFLFTEAGMGEPRYVVYGLLWLNVAVLVLWRVDPPSASFRERRRAVAIATVYFGVVAMAGSLINAGSPEFEIAYRIALLPPGWGPAFVFASPWIQLVVKPAYLLGYVALSYLVYNAVLTASRSAAMSVVGIFSCVSCTWPVVAGLATTVLGGGTFLTALAVNNSYDLSTVVFLITVALLYWRPGFR
ncbi:MAG: hypothetical protein ABEH81_00315 [Halopenitus sp.]